MTEYAQREPSSRHVGSASSTSVAEESLTYQETERFLTWRKHARDLYQQLFHIDLVWESPVAQFMPFVTSKSGLTTHSILCGTRTGGQEQCYLQLLSATLPSDTHSLDSSGAAFCDVTGEVGGYGMAPHLCGLKMERRLLHNGDVLAARYMYANPLVLASASSDGNVYVFDWSCVSLNRFPNDPPRPRAPLPPSELSSNPTDEERINYQKRMRALHAVTLEQDRWDRRTGDGQHLLTLVGNNGPSDALDWNVTSEGLVMAGSLGRVCIWQVGDQSKDEARTVNPINTYSLDNEEARVTAVNFLWDSPSTFVCTSTSGSVLYGDDREGRTTEIFCLPTAATSVSVSSLDSTSMLIGAENGEVHFVDVRKSAEPVLVEMLHAGEVTTAQWCPHSRHLFATGGQDAKVCVYNHTREQLLFKHAGHTDGIMDLGWNWQENCAGLLLSVDSNAMMVWRPRDYFFVR